MQAWSNCVTYVTAGSLGRRDVALTAIASEMSCCELGCGRAAGRAWLPISVSYPTCNLRALPIQTPCGMPMLMITGQKPILQSRQSGWDGADRRSSWGPPSPLRSPAACPLRGQRQPRNPTSQHSTGTGALALVAGAPLFTPTIPRFGSN
jgi:hypothetical protein